MLQLYFVINTASNEIVARFEGPINSKRVARYLVTNNLSPDSHKILAKPKKSEHDFFDCYTIDNGVIVELVNAEDLRVQKKVTKLITENEPLSLLLSIILDELNTLRALVTPQEPGITKDEVLARIKANLPK